LRPSVNGFEVPTFRHPVADGSLAQIWQIIPTSTDVDQRPTGDALGMAD